MGVMQHNFYLLQKVTQKTIQREREGVSEEGKGESVGGRGVERGLGGEGRGVERGLGGEGRGVERGLGGERRGGEREEGWREA